VAYCYRLSSVVGRSVCLSVWLSVCHTSEPCENGCTDGAAVWVEDSGGPRERCIIRWGPDPPWEGSIFRGEGRPIVKYRDTLWSSVQKQLNRSRCLWVVGSDGPKESCARWESTGAWQTIMGRNLL